MTADEREDWQTLQQHPGFLRLKAYAREQFNDKLNAHVASAAGERDDAMALNKLRQVIAAKHAIEGLLAYPAERVAALEHRRDTALEPPSQSRRGLL